MRKKLKTTFGKKYLKESFLNNKDIIVFPIKYSNDKYKRSFNPEFYETYSENEVYEIAHKAILEIRKCKSRQDLLKIRDKYKGLEKFSKIYKKVLIDRYEILF